MREFLRLEVNFSAIFSECKNFFSDNSADNFPTEMVTQKCIETQISTEGTRKKKEKHQNQDSIHPFVKWKKLSPLLTTEKH